MFDFRTARKADHLPWEPSTETSPNSMAPKECNSSLRAASEKQPFTVKPSCEDFLLPACSCCSWVAAIKGRIYTIPRSWKRSSSTSRTLRNFIADHRRVYQLTLCRSGEDSFGRVESSIDG